LIVVETGVQRALMLICIFIVVMFFLKNLMRVLAYYFLSPLRNGVIRDIRENIESRLLMLPLGYFTEERRGNILSKVTYDVTEVEWAIIGSVEMLFRDPITLLIYLVTMLIMSWQLTLFVLVLLPISALFISLIGKSLKRPAQKGTEKMGEVISIVEETLAGMKIIKAFGAEEQVLGKFRTTNNEHFRLMTKVYRRQYLGSPASEFMGSLSLALLLWFGGNLILDKTSGFDGAFFIAYIMIFSQMIQPAKAISEALFRIRKGMVSVERINEILDAETEPAGPSDRVGFNEELSFNNVTFAYNDEKTIIDNLSLSIKKGETVALVGQSGGGKSTLANLIPRFYDINGGSITLDGRDVKTIGLKPLRELMGIVTQESILFNDTVFNNIAFGMDNVVEADVIEAAKIANAHDFISRLDKGYQTNIGDLGGKLSGGQRQRLSIARAVLKNPSILILDEATSALDTESERLVQDALEKLMKNRTSIVIAHRLSTVQHADKIVVIEKGKIVEQGTHPELIAGNGAYRRYFEMQSFS
ncbi:MAG: ABC transporter ATP-binding protein, partial [Bacteroidota bacterium]